MDCRNRLSVHFPREQVVGAHRFRNRNAAGQGDQLRVPAQVDVVAVIRGVDGRRLHARSSEHVRHADPGPPRARDRADGPLHPARVWIVTGPPVSGALELKIPAAGRKIPLEVVERKLQRPLDLAVDHQPVARAVHPLGHRAHVSVIPYVVVFDRRDVVVQLMRPGFSPDRALVQDHKVFALEQWVSALLCERDGNQPGGHVPRERDVSADGHHHCRQPGSIQEAASSDRIRLPTPDQRVCPLRVPV